MKRRESVDARAFGLQWRSVSCSSPEAYLAMVRVFRADTWWLLE
jgi:hypothetical protein